MLPEIGRYLNEVRRHLHLDPLTERRVLTELHTHFQERVADLQEQGVTEFEATKDAIRSFGRARVIARQMYEAYAKGSWIEALITSAPHLIVAVLFVTHLWRHTVAPVIFGLMVCVTLFGWWRGKPNWLYSWIGYSLFPLLIGGFFSWFTAQQKIVAILQGNGDVSNWLSLLAILVFYLASLWLIIRTTIRVVRRDWVLASLMLVPLPILGSWLFNIERVGGFQSNPILLHQWDQAIALVLIVLSFSSAFFTRLRQRVLKAGAVVILGVIAGTITASSLWGPLSFLGLLLVSILLLLFLLSPAWLETRLGHGEPKEVAGWSAEWLERPSTPR